jgi:hypothetical protein
MTPDYLPAAQFSYTKIGDETPLLNPLLFSLAGMGPLNPNQSPTEEKTLSDLNTGSSSFDPTTQAPVFDMYAQGNTGQYDPQEESPWSGFAAGGLATTHPAGDPQFYSQGGLGNMYVRGDGDGTSDSVPAMLANNEFVIPADVVSALGNGSSEAGAGVLEKFMYEIRNHKQAHNPKDLPPQSKGPLEYLSSAMQKGHRT